MGFFNKVLNRKALCICLFITFGLFVNYEHKKVCQVPGERKGDHPRGFKGVMIMSLLFLV